MGSPENQHNFQANLKNIAGQYFKLFQGITDAIFVHPFSEIGYKPFLEVNSAACTLLGYSRDELLNLSVPDVTAPKDAEQLGTQEVRSALKKHKQKLFQATLHSKTGQLIPVEINAQMIEHMGEPVIFSMVRDISASHEAIRKLKENEELLELMFHTVSEGITFLDMEGKIQKINEGVLMMHGYASQHELIGKTLFDLIAPVDQNRARANLERTIIEGNSGSLLYKFKQKSGSTFIGEFFATLLKNSQAQPIGFVAVIKDVSEQIRIEQALRESENRYKLLTEATCESIFICDKGVCKSLNNSAREMFGLTERDALDYSFSKWIQPEHILFVESQLVAQYPKPFEANARRKDGSVFPCEIQLKFKTERDKTTQIIALRDISERKKTEEINRELEEQLRQALKMEAIGRLTGGVAHDFNNILTVIISQSELLLNADLPPKIHSDLNRIYSSGKRASRLTNQLLAFSRKQLAHPKVIDFNAIIHDHIKMLQRLLGENIDIKATYSEEDIFVTIDTGQLEQVIMNLCVNARDAMLFGGTLYIETSLENVHQTTYKRQYKIKEGYYACLTVSDTGCGMDEKTLSHIFEPFFTTKGRGEGTGLGLSTVYGIIKQNHGFIDVESEIDAGTMFRIFIPITTLSLTPEEEKMANTSQVSHKATILLVEDDENVREVAMETLQHFGYKVFSAVNGKDGYDTFTRHADEVDLLLTDVVMPIMGGKELAEQVSDQKPNLPILFMSGYTDDIISSHGILKSEINLIQKPFNLNELAETVSNMLKV